ncbi:hypothetical protein Q4610_08175 [Sphingobium sp. HBC34]|uniref:Calcium-binding protein n=1 Tax=Sphingobium cyanobacteriorum TaxID=3063954 RepID=A0ABT8ZKF9_9SPHN|nr:hypothetical protein [Sphingobium sp. HBC34]MDO7835024.1 hypothetical protein [Sphingobium sp. HBC34]
MSQFNAGISAVGIGYDSVTGELSVYGAFGANIFRYSSSGTALGSYAVPGGGANDFDLDGVPVAFMMNGVLVPAGSMLVFNGESGVVEIYAVNPATGAVIASLITAFGSDHVVGGSYNPVTGTFFVVQDKVPAAGLDNLIAEIDPATGAVIDQFPTDTSGFTVNYGDLDVDPFSGALWVVSSDHNSVQRMAVDGTIRDTITLPAGIGGLSGIAFIPESPGEAFVVNTSGTVFRIGGFPVERSGTAGDDVLAGGSGDDVLDGGDGNDTLNAGAGNDTLRGGGAGLDLHYGGDGDDVILVDRASDIVTGEVYDGGAGQDSLILNFNSDGDISGVTLTGIESLTQSYFGFDTKLTAAQLDALTSVSGQSFTLTTGGSVSMNGTSINAQVFNLSNAGNVLSLAGATYTYNITVNGGAGDDAVGGTIGADSMYGNGGADILNGGDGDDILDGGTGADILRGGWGGDTYYIDNAGDRIEAEALAGGGLDRVISTISFSLGGINVEEIELVGSANLNATGNGFDNRLIGNAGNNVLNGATGSDMMEGGLGNDTYVVDIAGDVVVEGLNAGTDLVRTALTVYMLADNVENLTASGNATHDFTGNALDNILIGGALDDILNGAAGADRLEGGKGNDVYYVDNAGDVVVEAGGSGDDAIFSSVSYTLLGRYVETLTLTGSANINAVGNTQPNSLIGNSGNNVLRGGLGSDRLTGGAGSDIFGFDTTPGTGNVDRITDFSVADDTIRLSRSVFSAISATGPLAAGEFRLSGSAADADDHILYNSATGGLFYDADGNGAGAAILFARLTTGLALTSADFLIVA